MSRLTLAIRVLAGIATAALMVAAAQAQTYPAKPIRLILPYAPGGIIDTAGRHMATRLSESMGVSVVAENRPGAGGAVGADVAARATADGYTILLTDPGLVSNPTLVADTPYTLKQFQAISIIGSSPAVIVATNNLPVKTFAEFIAYAKANPGKLNFASAGIGTAPHLAGEMIKLQSGIDMQHIPYRGIGPAYPDLLSGKIQLAFSSIAGAVPFTADNRVRPIATTGIKRSAVFPDTPTVAESGLPGFDVDLWTGIYGPAGHAAGRIGEAQRRDQQGAPASGTDGGIRQDRHPAARHHAGGGDGVHAERVREVEEGDYRRQDQAVGGSLGRS